LISAICAKAPLFVQFEVWSLRFELLRFLFLGSLSLTDFQRNTASHVRALRETWLPKVLTVKGRAELVVQAALACQALVSKLELSESAMGVHRGLEDVEDERSSSLRGFGRRMRSRFRLRRRDR
jgi:hypothetical protein